ncbi:MAG: AgmX/PglI C-terminal domain-containing protein [Sandaracinaceae bacterium]
MMHVRMTQGEMRRSGARRAVAVASCAWAFAFGCGALGCGGAAPATHGTASRTVVARTTAETSHHEEEAPPPEVTVSGLTGSLSDVEAHGALDPRMNEFARCFFDHSSALHQLGGDVRLHIRVGIDGNVVSAYPEDSTVGHRDVERCLGEVAMHTRFPRPRGGEARLTWPISMDPPEDVRHAATWDPGRVAHLVERRAAEVLSQCAVAPEPGAAEPAIQVTAYVRGGRVIAAGAASREETTSQALDCVVDQVRRWPMPAAPRLAKVTFDLAPPAPAVVATR